MTGAKGHVINNGQMGGGDKSSFTHTKKRVNVCLAIHKKAGKGGGGAKHFLSHAERVGGRKKFRGSFDVSH